MGENRTPNIKSLKLKFTTSSWVERWLAVDRAPLGTDLVLLGGLFVFKRFRAIPVEEPEIAKGSESSRLRA